MKQDKKLLIGYAISGFGDQFYTFAIPLLLLTRSRSAILMGLLTAMEYLPTALFGLVIGSIFDKYSRKKIMFFSLIIQAILILIIPLLILHDFPIALVLFMIFLIGTFDLMSWTGYQILISESVSENELSRISGTVGLISSIQKTFGSGIAAIIVNLFNYLGGFILDSISFGYLTYVVKDIETTNNENNVQSKKSIRQTLSQGLKFILKEHDIKWLIISFFAANVGFQVVIPMLTFLLKVQTRASINEISIFFTVSSIASILGNFVYLRFSKKIKLGTQLIVIGLIITVGFTTMLAIKSLLIFTIGYAIVSFGSVWAQANFFTIIQSKTPDQYKGMVTATSTSLTRITGPLMAALSGLLVKISPSLIFFAAIICLVLSVLITLISGLGTLKYLNKQ